MQLWTPLENSNLNNTQVNVPEFKFPGGRQQRQAEAEKRRPQPEAWKQQMVGCMQGFSLVRTQTKISSHCVTVCPISGQRTPLYGVSYYAVGMSTPVVSLRRPTTIGRSELYPEA